MIAPFFLQPQWPLRRQKRFGKLLLRWWPSHYLNSRLQSLHCLDCPFDVGVCCSADVPCHNPFISKGMTTSHHGKVFLAKPHFIPSFEVLAQKDTSSSWKFLSWSSSYKGSQDHCWPVLVACKGGIELGLWLLDIQHSLPWFPLDLNSSSFA